MHRLTIDDRESVLILDNGSYDRSRSKMVELLSRVHDNTTGRSLKGFQMLTICWSDGDSGLPLNFALISSADKKSAYVTTTKSWTNDVVLIDVARKQQ